MGARRVVAVVNVDGPDTLDQILMDLPIMTELGQHVHIEVTPLRRYEDFAADVKNRLAKPAFPWAGNGVRYGWLHIFSNRHPKMPCSRCRFVAVRSCFNNTQLSIRQGLPRFIYQAWLSN